MLKIEALGFCNFYVHIGANSGKCEMQGISRKILKNHILCRLVQRKCGKRVEILCRDKEPETGTCRARAGLSLQRKNKERQ